MNEEYSGIIGMQDMAKEAPAEEPGRQYYFMAKCRRYVKAESERLGRAAL